MARMIVVIGPDAEQNRQFAEQMKYQRTHDLETKVQETSPLENAPQSTEARVSAPVLSRNADLGEVPDNQPEAALEPWEPDVKFVEVTPIQEDAEFRQAGLPGPAGTTPQAQQTLEEPTDEFTPWEPPKHDFGHYASTDPRQMLLTEMQKDIKDFQSAWEYRMANREAEAAAQPPDGTPGAEGATPRPGQDVQVTQEGRREAVREEEAVIDAEFRTVDPRQDTHINADAPTPLALETTPEGDFRYDTHLNAELPSAPQETSQRDVMQDVRRDIAADKTVVVTATEYNQEVESLMREAAAQGHRVQVAVIGENQGGEVAVREGHLNAIPELSKNSHFVSVYAQNDAGQYDLKATSYNDMAKVTPNVAPEVGNQLAKGIEAKGLHQHVAVQQVEGFKNSHPAVAKMQTQQGRGMDY